MNTQDWLSYFRQNASDRVPIPWIEGMDVGGGRKSLTRAFLRLHNLLSVPKNARCNSELLKVISEEVVRDAQLLARAITTLGERPPTRTILLHGSSVSVALASELVSLKLLGILRREANDPVIVRLCDQLLHDGKFRARFLCDQWRRTPSWLACAVWTALFAGWTGVECRMPLVEFCQGVRENFRAARRAVEWGVPFVRDAADQLAAAPEPVPRRMRLCVPRALREPPKLDPLRREGPAKPKTALLINPFYPKDPHASFGKHVLTPTLALTSIAGATPEGWHVEYWDENLLQGPPPCEPFPQVVGITVHLTFARRAFELAQWYRQRGAVVVLGGLHVISSPDECAPHADALAVGEGVQLWPEILRDVEAGRLQRVYHGDYRRPYRDDPPPRRELLPRGSFLTTSSMIATRGCHNRCGFCYLSTEGLHMPYLMRDVEQIVEEIRANGEPYVVFIDNNLGSRPEYLRKLCGALRPLEIIWSAAVTIDVTDDPSLVREMALAGCTGVFIGFESLSDQNLVDAHKKTPRTEDYARRVALLHENGIQVNGSFVLGFDHDRRDCFARTVEWIEANRLECATFHILTPYPGTPLFRQMEAEGRLLHKDWSLFDTAHVVFRPRHMGAEQLADGYAWCYERLFSHRSIWRRRPSDARAVLPYLAMSYLYKRSNLFWQLLIWTRLTHAIWRPLVEVTRKRHVRFRRRLAAKGMTAAGEETPSVVVPAGV